MGCAISNFHNHLIDLSKRSNLSKNTNNALIVAPHNLYRFLQENNPHPKCIFIFARKKGGIGSNKGQFIWEIMEQSCENFHNNKNNKLIKLLLINDDEIDYERFRFSYHYIDVENLIINNIDDRIRKLTIQQSNETQMLPSPFENNTTTTTTTTMANSNISDPLLLDELKSVPIVKRKKSDSQDEQLRLQLQQYANIITNNWLLTLLKQEIERQNHGPYENIFIINLIPNRITLFRQCLFLRQTPSFINFDYNYVAIKLIRHSTRRKELEIKNNGIIIGANTFDDNVDDNYTNYFRATNKLYEIRVKNAEDRIRLRLSTSNKTAIPISNRQELISFIQMPKKDLLEINISEFHFNQRMETILDRCRQQTLLFIINNEIDLDDNIKLLIINNNNNQDRQQQYDLIFLRKFIQLYRLTSYALKFV
ncbi:uncharacterized protein LOC124490868 [Dermatophagoides farinae]|uniref:uncharacterized protein LOC124490868 n=1 Tax=Dermatophagoides farinae TaxID=6954 RepID=UPI003F61DBA5